MIEVGDIVVSAKGPTDPILVTGSDYYDHAVCVSVNPFILISKTGDMRWSNKNADDFVSRGKASSVVLKTCMKRLLDDMIDGEVNDVSIGSNGLTNNITKVQPIQENSISIEEKKDVWLRAWVATASSSNTSKSSTPTYWADICLEEYLQRFDK